ncbi:MAG TPA: nicotinate-nucleotide adenylyltransferase [Gemmatimonadota bacterium]|nr:nicotinate-nucleotide adenylyltransferase [Gemmatimonadota bacterium]
MAPLRKGVFGGAFNPPHVAHLIVAHVVGEAMSLDQVLFVPSSVHPFKNETGASPAQRAAMAELAVAGDRRLEVDRIEVRRGGLSYTVDTLAELREREPGTEWHLILGQDNLPELPQWKEAQRLPELATIVVMTRGGGQAAPGLPFDGHAKLVPVPGLDVSSTTVRERVAAGRSIRYWVPAGVEAFIHARGLYRREVDENPGGA